MQVNGNIAGIRRALLYNGRITADLKLISDTLNVNELTVAMVAGSKFAELKESEKDEHSKKLDEGEIAAVHEEIEGVFVIPRNIDLKIRTQIDHLYYSNLTIDGMNSDIFVRNHTLEIPDAALKSNVGDMKMSLVYRAENTKGAHIGLDMDLKQVQVAELVSAFPILDSLTPMLRSFEGVIDCSLTFVADLDSLMEVVFPTASASCFMSGKDLVLMDGETFTELAKTLRFRNRQRNLIDSMQVEMILDGEQLLIFPFLLGIDRYVVAVGGTQRLDMTFDYHITVIRSPIPFRFGVNLIGNPDDWKIRLGRAKYTDLFRPARTASMQNVHLNVRAELQERLRNDIQNIVNSAPQQAERTWQRPTILNDEMRALLETHESEIVDDTTAVDVEKMEELGIKEEELKEQEEREDEDEEEKDDEDDKDEKEDE